MSAIIQTAQTDLFGLGDALPPGLSFEPDFVSAAEERELLTIAAALPLREARYKEYTARRRVYAYGARFDYDEYRLHPQEIVDLPAPLQRLRERLAAKVGVAADDFVHVMISEYARGTPLGWHRDALDYAVIVGLSLGSPARLRFRPYPPVGQKKDDIVTLALAPRSAYVMRDAARWGWQHSVPPVPGLRYSVTMRTLRRPA
jgi:alkylated DNA repair dioxygenase AlkB